MKFTTVTATTTIIVLQLLKTPRYLYSQFFQKPCYAGVAKSTLKCRKAKLLFSIKQLSQNLNSNSALSHIFQNLDFLMFK